MKEKFNFSHFVVNFVHVVTALYQLVVEYAEY